MLNIYFATVDGERYCCVLNYFQDQLVKAGNGGSIDVGKRSFRQCMPLAHTGEETINLYRHGPRNVISGFGDCQ